MSSLAMTSLFDSISSLPPPFNMFVFVTLIVTVASVMRTIVKEIRRYASHRHEVELKRDLLDRGMSADEIERVVQVRGAGSESKSF